MCSCPASVEQISGPVKVSSVLKTCLGSPRSPEDCSQPALGAGDRVLFSFLTTMMRGSKFRKEWESIARLCRSNKIFSIQNSCGHSTRVGGSNYFFFSIQAPLIRYIIFIAEFHILQSARTTWFAASTMPLVVRVHCRHSNEPAILLQHAQHCLLNHAFQKIKIQRWNTAHDTKPLFKHKRANCFYNLQACTIFASHVHAISGLKVSYPPCNMELDPWKSLMTIQLLERKSFPNTLRMLAKYLCYFHVYTLHYTVLPAFYTN